MKLLQLYYFKVLAENEHLTETADKLFVSPPALSATIARLEKKIGYTLFDHVGRNIKLNKNGQIFYKHVNSIFNSLDNAKKELKDANSIDRHTINIAVSALTLWSDAISSFLKSHPEVSLNHTALKMDKLQNMDFIEQFDLIITAHSDLSGHENYLDHAVIIPEDKPVLVVYPDHPYAELKEIDLIEAKDEPFVALTKGYSSRQYFDTICELAEFNPKIIIECDYPLRTQVVLEKYGISFSTITGSKASILKGLKFVEIKSPKLVRTQAIFWRKSSKLSNVARLFRDYIIEYYK